MLNFQYSLKSTEHDNVYRIAATKAHCLEVSASLKYQKNIFKNLDLRNILDLVVLSATIVETFCDQIIWTAQNRFSIRTIARNTLILTMSTNPNPYVLGMRPSSKWEASHIFISKPFSGL